MDLRGDYYKKNDISKYILSDRDKYILALIHSYSKRHKNLLQKYYDRFIIREVVLDVLYIFQKRYIIFYYISNTDGEDISNWRSTFSTLQY